MQTNTTEAKNNNLMTFNTSNTVWEVVEPMVADYMPHVKADVRRIAKAPRLTNDERLAFITDYIAGDSGALWNADLLGLRRKQEQYEKLLAQKF